MPGQLNPEITTGHSNTNEYSRPGYRQHSLSRSHTSRHSVRRHKKRKYTRRSSSSSSVSCRRSKRRHSRKKKRHRRRFPSSSSSSDSSVSRNSRSRNRRQTSSVTYSVHNDQEQVNNTFLPATASSEQFIHTADNSIPIVQQSGSLPPDRTPQALSIEAANSVASYLENNPTRQFSFS